MSDTPTTNPFVIVVGYDMSDQAERAVEQAIELAGPHPRVDLHVLGVLDNRRSLGHPTGQKYDYAAAEQVRDTIREAVDDILSGDGTSGLNLFVHTRIGAPSEELVTLAREAEADMLVVGTHGRSGVSRLFLGSVAEKVVRYAPCAVLVARPRTEHHEADADFQPEPPCPRCVARREETEGAVWWCEAHTGKHVETHVYSYSTGIAQRRSGPNALL